MDFQDIGLWHGLDWSGSGQGQVVDCGWHTNEPSDSIKCREFLH